MATLQFVRGERLKTMKIGMPSLETPSTDPSEVSRMRWSSSGTPAWPTNSSPAWVHAVMLPTLSKAAAAHFSGNF